MNEAQKTNGSLALGGQSRVITIPASEAPQNRRLRVAAYARVSSGSEDQKHSFAAQTAYYTEHITGNPEWDFVDVYADEGIAGTSEEKREDFQRLLADCRRGRIDKVLVKSSSRFARNTKECLEAVRELKALGVGVCFEEQGIDTSEIAGELLTALFAMMDQRESDADSQRMRLSYQQRMRSGQFITCSAPFGYRLVKGKLELVQEEAPIIQYIFHSYLSGKTAEEIANTLNRLSSTIVWKANRIDYILKNEKYSGNALLPKRYATDMLPRYMKRNHGEKPMYYVTGSNEAVVSQETFDQAQMLRKRRAEGRSEGKAGGRPLAGGWLQCGVCGKVLRPKFIRDKWYMTCRGHESSIDTCDLRPVLEAAVISATLRLYYKLRHQGLPVLHQLVWDLQEARKGRLLWSRDIMTLNN